MNDAARHIGFALAGGLLSGIVFGSSLRGLQHVGRSDPPPDSVLTLLSWLTVVVTLAGVFIGWSAA